MKTNLQNQLMSFFSQQAAFFESQNETHPIFSQQAAFFGSQNETHPIFGHQAAGKNEKLMQNAQKQIELYGFVNLSKNGTIIFDQILEEQKLMYDHTVACRYSDYFPQCKSLIIDFFQSIRELNLPQDEVPCDVEESTMDDRHFAKSGLFLSSRNLKTMLDELTEKDQETLFEKLSKLFYYLEQEMDKGSNESDESDESDESESSTNSANNQDNQDNKDNQDNQDNQDNHNINNNVPAHLTEPSHSQKTPFLNMFNELVAKYDVLIETCKSLAAKEK